MRTQRDSSIAYFFRNFFYLTPLALIPAVMFGITPTLAGWTANSVYEPKTIVNLFVNIFHSISDPTKFTGENFYQDIYSYISLMGNINYWWLWVIDAILAIFVMCCLFSAVERHMRLGVKQFGRLFTNVNDTIVPLLAYCVIMFAFYELLSVLASAFIYLFTTLELLQVTVFILSCLVMVVFLFIVLAVFTLTCLTIPCRIMDGYKFNVAVSYSCQLVGKKYWRVFSRLLLMLVVSLALFMSLRFIIAYNSFKIAPVIDTIVSVIFNLFWVEMIPIFCTRTYFSLTDGKRNDIKQKLF